MNATDQLEKIIEDYRLRLSSMDDHQSSIRPAPGKWSKKEILGHLVDSAQNNIRRFIVAQYEDTPRIEYAQDTWVALSAYQDYKLNELVELWVLLNKHAANILKKMNIEMLGRKAMANGIHTIAWLAEDYNKHMLHHLHHILDLEPVPYP